MHAVTSSPVSVASGTPGSETLTSLPGLASSVIVPLREIVTLRATSVVLVTCPCPPIATTEAAIQAGPAGTETALPCCT